LQVVQLSRGRSQVGQITSEIPSRTIVEREIVIGGINCPVTETKWVESQSNCGAWTYVTPLNKNSCTSARKSFCRGYFSLLAPV